MSLAVAAAPSKILAPARAVLEGLAVEVRECPLCGHASHRSLSVPGHWIGHDTFRGARFGLVRCEGCRLTFTSPRPADSLLSAFYDGETYVCHETDAEPPAAAKADLLLDLIEQNTGPDTPRTMLDYGAGGGGFLLAAAARGWRVTAFEPGRRGAESCRRAGLAVARDLGALSGERFCVITMHHVLEHLAEPVSALRRLRELVTPGGLLFVEVPNAGSLRARLSLPALSRGWGVDERYRAFPIHLVYYTAPTLRGMLARAGWGVQHIGTLGLGMDEYFVRRSAARPGVQRRRTGRGAGGGWRARARDLFLTLGLGEHLISMARTPRTRVA
jgi:SAM-dependent methyltransferase